ncbi:MAG: UPF0182 family protein, partial [Actinomycetota bacterium]
IRLWSPDLLAQAYTQLQRLTSYYEFLNVDIDRYKIGGTTRQVMLAPREVAPAGLLGQAKTWVNNHLVYTHGFGVVASRVDRATGEGAPDFIIRDTPPKGVAGAPPITEPRIYYGENEEQPFVIVNTTTEEIDYPTSQTSVATSSYSGKGGIKMSSFFRRVAFAWRFRDINILLSGALGPDAKIMFRRRVADRVAHVAPFLQLDDDPYITIADGRLVWIVDAYTTSSNYPYAQRIDLSEKTGGHLRGRANYIRNSVKATVDALDGTITLYLWDRTDPVIQAWNKVFPGLLKPATDMPAPVREHVRYPEDLFLVQADRYATYHITDPVDFYSKNDVWGIPTNPSVTDFIEQMPPYYVLMRLPGQKEAEFVLMLPFRPFSDPKTAARTNMTAWLAARSDPGRYGKLVSFVYGKSSNVPGPEQVYARINNDQIVRQQLTLLDPESKRIKFGDLLVIPVGEGVLYVQPLYLKSTQSPLPEFKRVVVVAGDQIRIGETLNDALRSLFGRVVPTDVPDQAR